MDIGEIFNSRQQTDFSYLQKKITPDKIDTFIKRCVEERGYTLRILHTEIHNYLNSAGMFSLEHDYTYQCILRVLADRINKGEK